MDVRTNELTILTMRRLDQQIAIVNNRKILDFTHPRHQSCIDPVSRRFRTSVFVLGDGAGDNAGFPDGAFKYGPLIGLIGCYRVNKTSR